MNVTALLGVCIIAAAVGTLLKNYKSEYALLVTGVAGATVFISVIFGAVNSVTKFRELLLDANIDTSYLKVAFKALGICLISGFVGDLCRDFGQSSLAARAEFVGRCAVFIISVPLLSSLLEIAVEFIN